MASTDHATPHVALAAFAMSVQCVPSTQTIIGGLSVLMALLAHLIVDGLRIALAAAAS